MVREENSGEVIEGDNIFEYEQANKQGSIIEEADSTEIKSIIFNKHGKKVNRNNLVLRKESLRSNL